jgi:hypothetical protein
MPTYTHGGAAAGAAPPTVADSASERSRKKMGWSDWRIFEEEKQIRVLDNFEGNHSYCTSDMEGDMRTSSFKLITSAIYCFDSVPDFTA